MASPGRERSGSPRRSKSPTTRRRSRSPNRERSPPRKPRMGGGIKWKDKSNRDRVDDDRDRRGGRNDSYRPNRYNDDRNNRGRDDRTASSRDYQERDREREKFREGDEARRSEHRSRREREDGRLKSSETKTMSKSQAAPPTQATYIKVFVNDRLGTKTQIPCLPSDTIGDFKKFVAASIGRKPHEIMLKRQGERPFKDHITLGDYEISNGVQLDLELDTGD